MYSKRDLNSFCALCFFLLCASPAYCATETKNLFEYAYVSYGDGGIDIPSPEAPIIKFYQNGTVIYRKGDKIYTGTLEQKQLEQLNRDLESHPLLQQSRFIEVKNAGMIGLHGGVCYIRYLDGDRQVVLATDGIPKGGEWKKLVKRIERYFPAKPSLFYPERTELNIQKNQHECTRGTENTPDDWPFSEKLQLASSPSNVDVTEPAINRYLFQRMYDGGSLWFSWGFCDGEKHYTIYLSKVVGWLRDDEQLYAGYVAHDLQTQWDKSRKR